MTDTLLHPGLQKLLAAHRRLSRLLSLLIFLPMAGMMVFAMASALHGDTLGDFLLLALIGGIVLLMVVSLGGLLAWLNHWTTRRVLDANRLLRENAPLAARLTPTAVNSPPGWLMAVESLDPLTAGPLGDVLIEPAPGRRAIPDGPLLVRLHCRSRQPGSRLVALQEGNALLGHWVDRRRYLRQRRWMMTALVAALGLTVVATLLNL